MLRRMIFRVKKRVNFGCGTVARLSSRASLAMFKPSLTFGYCPLARPDESGFFAIVNQLVNQYWIER